MKISIVNLLKNLQVIDPKSKSGFCLLESVKQRRKRLRHRLILERLPPLADLNAEVEKLEELIEDASGYVLELGDLRELSPQTRLSLYFLISKFVLKCRSGPKGTPKSLLDLVIERIEGHENLEGCDLSFEVAVQAVAIVCQDSYLAACSKIAARAKELGVSGWTARQVQKKVSEVQDRIEAEGAGREEVDAPPLGDVMPFWPEGLDVQLPPGYLVDNNRVTKGRNQVISLPLVVVGVAIEQSTRITQFKIAWFEGGRWHTTTVPGSTLADFRKIISLADWGVPVNSSNAKLVVEYLAAFLEANRGHLPIAVLVKRCGYHEIDGETVFLFGETLISRTKASEDPLTFRLGEPVACVDSVESAPLRLPTVVFAPSSAGERQIAQSYKSQGDFATWLEGVRPALEYPICKLTLMAGLSALLLPVVRAPNYVIDVVGETSGGKTKSTQATASAFGDPSIGQDGGLLRSWNATAVGSERLLGVNNSLPTFLDDSQEASSDHHIRQVIYTAVNGAGRTRGAVEGSREVSRHRGVIISTGEASLTSKARSGGASARVLTLKGRPFGPPSSEVAAMLRRVDAVTQQNHGLAAPLLVRFLLDNQERWEEFRTRFAELTAAYSERANGDAVLERNAPVMAVIDLTAELFAEAAEAPWLAASPVDPLYEALTEDFREADIAVLAVQALYENFVANQHLYFDACWNSAVSSTAPARSWRGVCRFGPDIQLVGFTQVVFAEVLRNAGLDPDVVRTQLRSRGWLQAEPDGRHFRWRMQLDGRQVSLIAINAEGLRAAGCDPLDRGLGGEVSGGEAGQEEGVSPPETPAARRRRRHRRCPD